MTTKDTAREFVKSTMAALAREPHKEIIARYMALQSVMTLLVMMPFVEAEGHGEVVEQMMRTEMESFNAEGRIH